MYDSLIKKRRKHNTVLGWLRLPSEPLFLVTHVLCTFSGDKGQKLGHKTLREVLKMKHITEG